MYLIPAYSLVITQDIANLFSDIYKDDAGVRPDLSAWDRESMAAYLDNRKEPEYGRCCSASDDCYCCHYDWCYNSDHYYEWLEDDEYGVDSDRDEWYYEIASQYQEGWT